MGQGSVWSLSWRELSIWFFFPHAVTEILKGGERGLDAEGVIQRKESAKEGSMTRSNQGGSEEYGFEFGDQPKG